MAAVSNHFYLFICLLSFFYGISYFLLVSFFYSARVFFILMVHILFFWRTGVHNSTDQGAKHLGGKGDGLIDGYNNEAVKGGAGALAFLFFHYTFFVWTDEACVCCVCNGLLLSLKKKNLLIYPLQCHIRNVLKKFFWEPYDYRNTNLTYYYSFSFFLLC
jgi:hypothetical protein